MHGKSTTTARVVGVNKALQVPTMRLEGFGHSLNLRENSLALYHWLFAVIAVGEIVL